MLLAPVSASDFGRGLADCGFGGINALAGRAVAPLLVAESDLDVDTVEVISALTGRARLRCTP